MSDFNYKRYIDPIVSELLERDDLKQQANRGQMQEIVRELSLMMAYDDTVAERLLAYGYDQRRRKIIGDAEAKG